MSSTTPDRVAGRRWSSLGVTRAVDDAVARRPRDRWDWAIVGCIMAVVSAIGGARTHSGTSMWRDEAWTWLVIHRPLTGVVGVVLRDEANMGPYYLGLRVWSIVNGSDAWIRGFSVAGGVAAAAAIYLLVRESFGRLTATVSAILLVTNPVFLRYLTEARAYSWSMAFAVFTTMCVLRLDGRPRRTIAYGVIAGIGVAINLMFVLVVVAQLAGVLSCRGWRRSRPALVGAALAALTFLPFLPITIIRRNANLSWVTRLSGHTLLRSGEAVFGGYRWTLLLLVGAALALIVCYRSESARIIVATAILPTLALLLIGLVRPVFVDRYLTPCVPLACAGAAIGFIEFSKVVARVRWGSAATAAAVAAIAVWLFALGSPFTIPAIEPLRESAQFLSSQTAPSDELLFYPTWSRASVYRYWQVPRAMDVSIEKWPDWRLFPIEHDTAEMRARIAAAPRIWLVYYPSNWHPRADPLQPLIAEIRKRPVIVSRKFAYFVGLTVTLYGPARP